MMKNNQAKEKAGSANTAVKPVILAAVLPSLAFLVVLVLYHLCRKRLEKMQADRRAKVSFEDFEEKTSPSPGDIIDIVAAEFHVASERISFHVTSSCSGYGENCGMTIMYLCNSILGEKGCVRLSKLTGTSLEEIHRGARMISHRMVMNPQLWEQMKQLEKKTMEFLRISYRCY